MRALHRLAFLAFVLACNKSADPPEPTSASTEAQAAVRSEFDLATDDGAAWASAAPRDDGYSLKGPDGAKRGKIKIESDRVKVKDAAGTTVAKAKAKDYGFKLYKGDEAVVAKAKRKGAGFKLKREDGTEVGTLNEKGPGNASIVVETTDTTHVVKRDGAQVGAVGSSIGPEAAAFLGLTELAYEERVAAMIFVQEHIK